MSLASTLTLSGVGAHGRLLWCYWSTGRVSASSRDPPVYPHIRAWQSSGGLRRRNDRRYPRRCADAHPLEPAGLSGLDHHGGFAHPELPRQPGHQMLVGLAADGWGGDAYPQAVVVRPCKLVSAGSGLQLELEQQISAFPTIPARHYRIWAISDLTGGISSISNSTRPSMTAIGDRSRPPILGMRRRTGASSGSVRLWIRPIAGL